MGKSLKDLMSKGWSWRTGCTEGNGSGGSSSESNYIDALIETDLLPAVHDNGKILTNKNGNIILRY